MLLVFPEGGTGFLSVPHEFITLFCEPVPEIGWRAKNCSNDGPSNTTEHGLHADWASCAAQRHGIHIVINFCETSFDKCTNITRHYNDDVGFDSDGVLQAKYRKMHIAGTGPYLNEPTTLGKHALFTTKFNVTFGMFTCYDFWFLEPMMEELVRMGVNSFIFPNQIASGQPFFTMPALVSSWSLVRNVDVISATFYGTGAAGIYTNGNVKRFIQPQPSNFSSAHQIVFSDLAIRKASTGFETPKADEANVEELADDTASSHVVVYSNSSKCLYANVSGLNFTIGCAVFRPTNGTTYHLFSNHSDFYGSAQCEATLTAASNSNTTWLLASIMITEGPTVGTPHGLSNAGCIIVMCDDPSVGCMQLLRIGTPISSFVTYL